MSDTLKCISPIDGSVYAERPAMSLEAASEAVGRARKAQKAWARRPLEDRIQLVLKGVARLNEMSDEVVPELAHMMGRPVRYGGEYKGFNGGIAPEIETQLFNPFFTTKVEGMGLGLSLCRTVVEQHGGHLAFEPHTPKGTVFRFTLPAATGGGATASA